MKQRKSTFSKPVKVKLHVQPIVADGIMTFCERFHCSFTEACHILLNENLKAWEAHLDSISQKEKPPVRQPQIVMERDGRRFYK